MEAIVNWLKETHQKNWVLFCVVFGITNALFMRFAPTDWYKERTIFLMLEVLTISLSATRILVAMDIIYLLQIWPITGDLIILVDRRKKREIRYISQTNSTEIIESVLQRHSQSVYDEMKNLEWNFANKVNKVHKCPLSIHILFHYYKHRQHKTLYTTTYFIFWSIIALVCCYFIGMVFGNEITTFFYASLIILYAHNNCPN
jgi:hypothetical protein